MAQPSHKTLQDTSTPIERITSEDIGKLPQVNLQDLENLHVPSLDQRDNRSPRNDAERAMNAGRYTSVVARDGDSISRILGTASPQAIGNFMLSNNLTGDGIQAGKNYFVPSSLTAYESPRQSQSPPSWSRPLKRPFKAAARLRPGV